MEIGDLLHRRADLSTFVVHLTKDDAKSTAGEKLERIIRKSRLRAGSAMGWAQDRRISKNQPVTNVGGESQEVVSFSETPLEHIYSLFADIEGRRVNLQGYGVAFTKMVARERGANPVWYVDRTAGASHQWRVAAALDDLARFAVASPADPQSANVGKILPFFEVMGTWPDSQKEFWWEREWRHVGHFEFDLEEVALWLAPEQEHAHFEAVLDKALGPGAQRPRCVDPEWGLERIIARLVGLKQSQVTPFG